MTNEPYIPTKREELKNRWVSILRIKADYEHKERNNGKTVPGPSIDAICNEIETSAPTATASIAIVRGKRNA